MGMVNCSNVVSGIMSFCRDAKCCISIGTYHFQPRNGIGRFCFCLMLSSQHIILRFNTSTKSPIGYISYFHSCTNVQTIPFHTFVVIRNAQTIPFHAFVAIRNVQMISFHTFISIRNSQTIAFYPFVVI